MGSGQGEGHIKKHGIRSPDAALALDDPGAITILDNESDPSEQRFVSLGLDPLGRLLVVVYMWRGEDVRLISARPAAPRAQGVRR